MLVIKERNRRLGIKRQKITTSHVRTFHVYFFNFFKPKPLKKLHSSIFKETSPHFHIQDNKVLLTNIRNINICSLKHIDSCNEKIKIYSLLSDNIDIRINLVFTFVRTLSIDNEYLQFLHYRSAFPFCTYALLTSRLANSILKDRCIEYICKYLEIPRISAVVVKGEICVSNIDSGQAICEWI